MNRLTGGSLAVALLAGGLAALWAPGNSRAQEAAPQADASSSSEVTITSKYTRRTLETVIVPRFVESHSVATLAIGQIPRWRGPVCPSATGLRPEFNDLVARRIVSTAQSIGALTAAGQKCAVNIEVVFTSTPQELLDKIDQQYPWLLGSARRSGDTHITRAVQSWYGTGTRQEAPPDRPVVGFNRPNPKMAQGSTPVEFAPSAASAGLATDAPYGGVAPSGQAESYLTARLRSELVHVLVIVDSSKLLKLSLEQVSDYIAMISLTRITTLDTCNQLPSILDLLAESCSSRPPPTGLTPADAAFLKALYSTELDKTLNVEEGEVRDRMMAILLDNP
jgi:hypothetical protein